MDFDEAITSRPPDPLKLGPPHCSVQKDASGSQAPKGTTIDFETHIIKLKQI